MRPELFGWQHLVYLAVSLIITALVIVFAKKYAKTQKQQTILIKVVAGILFAFIMFNRISIVIKNDGNIVCLLPDTFCGLTSLSLSLFTLFGKPNIKAFSCLWYMAIVGGIATIIYPTFLGQNESFFYPPTISGLLHHTVMILLACLLLEFGWFKPRFKDWYWFPIGVACYILVGVFEISMLGVSDAVCIFSSEIEGTPLNCWFFMGVGTILVVVFTLLWELVGKKLAKRDN